MNKENQAEMEESEISEFNLIKKLLLAVFIIMVGIAFLNLELSILMIPGLILMFAGLIDFVLTLSFNASQINQYDEYAKTDSQK
ncbi:MAG: hypothetical protein ACOCQS_01850 [Bacillota bacterium]